MARTNIRVSAIILRDNKILLIHRKKNGEEYWVFPGGGVEDTETIEEAIVREVKEETNLDVLKQTLIFNAHNESSNKKEPFFLCEVSKGDVEITGEEKYRNSSENWYQLEWVELSNLQNIWLVPKKAAEEIVNKYN